eukprot:TRINITY_DN6148_c0_g2_i1.p1 TRINITY_DN6148_c0_g2~~TRINITY_DN6148_c0_g2_i1.p1  ORF type:complete len:271 (+),score=89.33 TRINITY_DN6148_c0_g2_i1:83-895(+)
MPPCVVSTASDAERAGSGRAAERVSMPKLLKICGVRCAAEVAAAMCSGVEYIGLVFVHGSARSVLGDIPECARMVAEVNRAREERGVGAAPVPYPAALGVFERRRGVPLEDEVEEINRIVAETGLHCAQLYGFSAEEYDGGMRGRLQVPSIVFAVSVRSEGDVSRMRVPDDPAIHAFCIDHSTGTQLGGTGKSFDWSWLRSMPSALAVPLFLAGGIRLSNIDRARSLPQVAALDISSGAEVDGRINAERVAQLAAAAHAASFALCGPAQP